MLYAKCAICDGRVLSILYSGKFLSGAKFHVFLGQAVNAKIKTGRNSHAPVFHMQSYWWVWFPGIKTRIIISENVF